MFEVFGKELYLSFFQDELSNILNLQMKTAIRKMVTYNKVIFFKKLLISVVFMVFFVLLLYVLINSPA